MHNAMKGKEGDVVDIFPDIPEIRRAKKMENFGGHLLSEVGRRHIGIQREKTELY